MRRRTLQRPLRRRRRTTATALLLAVLVWAVGGLAITAAAVVFDAAELPPFATSSRWAPLIGGVVATLPAWYVFRARRAR